MTIGNGVTSIGSKTFAKCSELTDVYCYVKELSTYNDWNPIGLLTSNDAFDDSYPKYITLHVPAGSIAAYSEVEPWKNFKEIVAIEDTGTTGIVSMDNRQWIMDKTSDQWYNLNGQGVGKPTKKDLYIHNGRKVIIR